MFRKLFIAIILLAGLTFGATQPQQVRKATAGPLCIPHVNCPF
jgi:hypothetical protein